MSFDVVIFVEDPGAVNYILDLPHMLRLRNISYQLLATGHASEYLLSKNISFQLVKSESGTDIINSLCPKLLLIGTSENVNTFGFELISAARLANIRTISWIDAYVNAAYRFRGNSENPLEYAADLLLVPDVETKEAFVKLGYPAKNAIICGHPYYDRVLLEKEKLKIQGQKQLRKKFFPNAQQKKLVMFVAETSTGLNDCQYQYSSEYTLSGWGKNKKRTNIVIEEFLTSIKAINTDCYLILRLHPKNMLAEFDEYLSCFDYISQAEPSLEMVYASDLIVGMASSLVFEAYLLGKSVLSILPRECEKQWLNAIAAGTIPCATSRWDVQLYLLQMIDKENLLENSDKYFTNNSLERMSQVIMASL